MSENPNSNEESAGKPARRQAEEPEGTGRRHPEVSDGTQTDASVAVRPKVLRWINVDWTAVLVAGALAALIVSGVLPNVPW